MIEKSTYILFLLLLISQNSFSRDYKVANITEFNASVQLLEPGDQIILENGVWKDVDLRFKARGSKNKPITLMAQTPGKVIISGKSSLSMAGSYLIVRDIWFKDGVASGKAVISFRLNSKDFATHSRLTNCAITNFNPRSDSLKYSFVDLWGKSNRIDHNYLSGKTNEGPTVIVWLKGKEHQSNEHCIDNNYFGERPALGRNGGETIRIGTSDNSMFNSFTRVERNYFERCNGESEIISNKSGGNEFRDNLFFESKGSLVLRHGDNAIVENNVFDGNNVKWTGGVRVINQGHLIRNNLFINLRGEDLKSPFVIMNGVPNSPLNRYKQVKRADVQFNTFINCTPLRFGAGSDEERSLPPIESIFANNLFFHSGKQPLYKAYDDLNGITFKNNKVGTEEKIDFQGFESIAVETKLVGNIPIPLNSNGVLDAKILSQNTPENDITDTSRKKLSVGAFHPGTDSVPLALKLKPGPDWINLKNIN